MTTKVRTGPSTTILASVVAGIAVLALVAVLLTRNGGRSAAGIEESRRVEVTGAPLPAYPQQGLDPALGLRAPAVSGARFDGSALRITPGSKPLVVIAVAHWCNVCQAEVPVIQKYWETIGPPEGVDVVAISTSVNEPRGNYPPSAWLERESWPIHTLADDASSSAASAFGVTAFPFFAAIDSTGKVVQRVTGALSETELTALFAAARAS